MLARSAHAGTLLRTHSIIQSTEKPRFLAGAAALSGLIHALITVVLKRFETIFKCIKHWTKCMLMRAFSAQPTVN